MKSNLRYLVVALVACSDPTQNPPTQLNLDRPVDVSFACYGGLRLNDGSVTISAQPIASCDIRSGERTGNERPVPPGQEDRPGQTVPTAAWYAFILQSGPGTVALARFETKPSSSFGGGDVSIQDADPLIPGRNGISVGEDPVAIATDASGCYEVIANAGSCDISVLDINSVFTPDPIVNRIPIKNAVGEIIRARPTAMAFQPSGGTIGNACSATPTGLAYIAYPSCHLVAGVDMSTGMIVTGIKFDAMGVPTVTTGNVSCPAECDGPMPTMPGARPVALDLEEDPRTSRVLLAIGSDNSEVLHAYDLDPQTYLPLSATSIPLENTNGRLGVTSVAITPQIGMGGFVGIINDEESSAQHQFVYAVANDGTVRVADVSGAPRECDTQVDPRFLREVRDVDRLSCLKVGDATTPPRRSLARGPGIELLGDAVPTSVEIFKVPRLTDAGVVDPRDDVRRLIGYFAIVTAVNGQTYVINVDNDDFQDFVDPGVGGGLRSPIPLAIAHQLRDAIPDRGDLADFEKVQGQPSVPVCNDNGPEPQANGANAGGPRGYGNPSRSVPAGSVSPEKSGGLPSIRQVLCTGDDGMRPVTELSFSAPIPVREAEFPDLRALRADEVWSLTWEGSLSVDKVDTAIDGPSVRFGQTFVDGLGMHLVDQSRPFCDAGVEPYDIVQMRGCDPAIGDDGCPVGYTCYVHPQSQVGGQGTCELIQEAERLEITCRDFFVSMKRYTVGRTKSGELQLLPRKHELRTTPLDGCTSDAQCEMLADYALHNVSSVNPKDDTTTADPKTWACHADPDRSPKPGTGKRCLLVCDTDADCSTGTVCQANAAAGAKAGFCMEGVIPAQACVNAPQRYELRAGEAFALVGTRHGYVHSITTDAGGNCVRSPTANPFQVSRIPLDPPACDPTADPVTGRRADGTYQPNPCKLTVAETEYQLNYVPGTCTLADPDENLVTRDAEGLRLNNRSINLTIVDPSYPGDLQCHGDRMANLGRIPLVAPGFQISFRQTAGFLPLTLGINPSFPVKVLRGPQDSIWVVDQGDFLSTSLTQPSTRGKVYRVESPTISVVNVLE